jgi:hypothetical protein
VRFRRLREYVKTCNASLMRSMTNADILTHIGRDGVRGRSGNGQENELDMLRDASDENFIYFYLIL